MASSALSRHSAFFYLFFFILLLLLLLLSPTSQARESIPLGSSLSTADENTTWTSPSGDYAFGFYRLPDNGYFLLAIWFNKIPRKTVAWSANRDDPVQIGSKVELKTDGQLVLYDHQGKEKWKRNAGTTGTTSAAMLDTGNFVLMNRNSSPMWRSFDEPTDTILPRQTLNMSDKLISSRTVANYSKGKFELRMQDDGNLVLYAVARYGKETYSAYWASGTVGSGDRVVYNESGYVNILETNGTINTITPGDVVSTHDFYHRVTLDSDGVLRQYVYPKTVESGAIWAQSWSVLWFRPTDMCMAINNFLGSGTCGYNSYCRLDEDNRPTCLCPPGYSTLDPNNSFGGCKQDFTPQSCESGGSVAAGQFELKEMRNVDWPFSDYEQYHPIDEGKCRQFCLDDCFCAVAVYNEDATCWKKKMPLSNGKVGPSVSRKTFIKVPKDFGKNTSLETPSSNRCKGKKDRTILILIVSVLFGSSALLNFLLLLAITLVLLYSYHRKKLNCQVNTSMLGINIRSFTFKELEEATDGFKEELDRGAFGAIYKGILALDTRHPVSVKKLNKVVDEADKEFKTEVATIGQTYHKNLNRLLGFCDEGAHRLLVYEFMSNGSLASFLFGSMRPDWNQRTQIVLGIARGLTYLHEECSIQITHCDINPHNILLDESFTPRISDFGLAKLMKTDQTKSITGIRGTKGYVAPEWFKNIPITAKVDVYSFGVLLLEIICCRRNVESGLINEERVVLTDWAYDCYAERRIDLLVENDEEAMNDMKRVERLVMVAIWCIQENPTIRPSMENVTEMLEGVVEVSAPLDPYSVSSTNCNFT